MLSTDIPDKDIPTLDPETLIVQYTPLINRIAQRYKPVLSRTGSIDVEDLQQAGRIALCDAQKKYNPEAGASFITYAFNWIRSAMRKTAGIDRIQDTLLTFSLDAPLSDDSDITLADMIADDAPTAEEKTVEQDAKREVADAVHAAVTRLKNGEQREAVQRIWLDEQNRHAAADEMGITYQRLQDLDKAGRYNLCRDNRLKLFAMPRFSVGLNRFNSSWTSAVEMAVIWRDEHLYHPGAEEPAARPEG